VTCARFFLLAWLDVKLTSFGFSAFVVSFQRCECSSLRFFPSIKACAKIVQKKQSEFDALAETFMLSLRVMTAQASLFFRSSRHASFA